jgi:hypothetical protein
VNDARLAFMMDSLDTHHGTPRPVKRESIYSDVVEMYEEDVGGILAEFPFRIRYENERGIDTGGVCRDMFSGFWEHAYIKNFDGERLLVPSLNPSINMNVYNILGTILTHGYMCCGFLPTRIAFPVIMAILKGPDVSIQDGIFLEAFVDFLCAHDSSKLREAFISVQKTSSLPADTETSVIDILSRYGCTEMPTGSNLKRLVISVAKHIFIGKPLGLLYKLRSGVPLPYNAFWEKYSVETFYELYKALNATIESVLSVIVEPEDMNAAEKRVFNFFLTFICNMKNDELRTLIRFITGSSVLVTKEITVSFNHLKNLARRPISHACGSVLELSVAYSTFPEFEEEFKAILVSEYSWIMDAL